MFLILTPMASPGSRKDQNTEGHSNKPEGSLIDVFCVGAPELRFWTAFRASCGNEDAAPSLQQLMAIEPSLIRKLT